MSTGLAIGLVLLAGWILSRPREGRASTDPPVQVGGPTGIAPGTISLPEERRPTGLAPAYLTETFTAPTSKDAGSLDALHPDDVAPSPLAPSEPRVPTGTFVPGGRRRK